MPGPPTVGGVPAPLLDIWSAAQPVLVLPPSSRPGHTITPPTPPIPPRGPQPPGTTTGTAGEDVLEVPFDDEPAPAPMKVSKTK